MKKKGLWILVALLLLAGVLVLLTRFGVEDQVPVEESSSQTSVTTSSVEGSTDISTNAPSGGTDSPSSGKQLVLSSEDTIDWKIKEFLREDGSGSDYLYYFTAELEAGKEYRMEMHLQGTDTLDGLYAFPTIGFGFVGETAEEYHWEQSSEEGRFQVERGTTKTEVVYSFTIDALAQNPVVAEFYAQGSPYEYMLPTIDPTDLCPVAFELYCVQ